MARTTRILESIYNDGTHHFTPQRKGLLWGWNDISSNIYGHASFDTYEEALEKIQSLDGPKLIPHSVNIAHRPTPSDFLDAVILLRANGYKLTANKISYIAANYQESMAVADAMVEQLRRLAKDSNLPQRQAVMKVIHRYESIETLHALLGETDVSKDTK